MSKSGSQGFTIIELLIASSVFSVILLICTAGVIYVGRLFYKGVTSSATQEVARSASEQLASDFSLSGGTFVPLTTTGGFDGFCIGSHLYSYKQPGSPISTAGVGHALVVRDVLGCDTNPLVKPDNLSTGNDAIGVPVESQWRELLGPSMRLEKLTYTTDSLSPHQSITFNINVVAGENSLSTSGLCNGGAGSQFCASSELSTYTTRRL